MEKQQETPITSSPQNLTSKTGEDKGKWYVIHIQSGYEQKTKQALQQRIKSLGMEDKIFDVIIPMREVVAVKRGKKTKQKEKVFPGYILVKMILDDDSWLVVRTTEGVTGFVGAGLKPTPISDKEVEAIMKFVQQEQPKFKAKFSVGEAVKITEGPFADFLGTIEAIDEARGKVRVLVSIFDRETPVELDFLQVQKL
jgi:transcriptional antiterminator NusG